MSYCNQKRCLIVPDPTINLQRVVDNGYRLQTSLPNTGETMGFNGANVVWGNFGLASVTAGNNIDVTGTSNPTVGLKSPLTSTLNMGTVALSDSTTSTGTSGQYLTAGSGGTTLWATLPTSVSSVTAGNNIDVTGTTNPIVGLDNPLTAVLNLGSQNVTGTTGNITFTNAPYTSTISANSVSVSEGTLNSTLTDSSLTITSTSTSESIQINSGHPTIIINGETVCPEYVYYRDIDFSIPSIQPFTSHKITVWNKGNNPKVIKNAYYTFASPLTPTVISTFQGYPIIGTIDGFCYYWDDNTWNPFARFDGDITSFTESTYNGKLYIGGGFNVETINPQICNNIAGCNTDWNIFQVISNNTGSNGFSDKVNCLNQSGYSNLLLVGGEFTTDSSGTTFNHFAILDFKAQTFNNPKFIHLDYDPPAGNNGGFDGAVYTISSYKEYVFTGGAFRFFIQANNAFTDCRAGALCKITDDGRIFTVGKINQIGDNFVSAPYVNSSYFNPSTKRFCVGFKGQNNGLSNYLEFSYVSPNLPLSLFNTPNEIVSVYVTSATSGNYFTYMTDINDVAYVNGNPIGKVPASSRGQRIVWLPKYNQICFVSEVLSDYGFYTWTEDNLITCDLPTTPTNTLVWHGQPSLATRIELLSKGSWFTLYWDETVNEYQLGQYHDINLTL